MNNFNKTNVLIEIDKIGIITKKVILLFLVLFGFQLVEAKKVPVNHALNKKEILPADSTGKYSFFVSGHFHGSSKNTTGLPAKTLLSNLKRINDNDASFLVCLGDLFLDIKNDIPTYKDKLIDKLNMPLYNVPGNHDISGKIYENNFGSTFYYFLYQTELFIFLDTELDDGSITGAQLNMFKLALRENINCKNIFVFTHRLIWAEEHPKMKHLFNDNTRSKNGNNFRSELLPLIEKYSKGKNIYLMGGSLGNAPSPFFFHQEKNIIYLATAIRDTPKDAFLEVEIVNGIVNFSAFPLAMPIEFYNLDFYNGKHQKEPGFNWKLIPLYIKNMFSHRYFWYGILALCLPLVSIYSWRKFRRK